jgi:hypothetical protein
MEAEGGGAEVRDRQRPIIPTCHQELKTELRKKNKDENQMII